MKSAVSDIQDMLMKLQDIIQANQLEIQDLRAQNEKLVGDLRSTQAELDELSTEYMRVFNKT